MVDIEWGVGHSFRLFLHRNRGACRLEAKLTSSRVICAFVRCVECAARARLSRVRPSRRKLKLRRPSPRHSGGTFSTFDRSLGLLGCFKMLQLASKQAGFGQTSAYVDATVSLQCLLTAVQAKERRRLSERRLAAISAERRSLAEVRTAITQSTRCATTKSLSLVSWALSTSDQV